MKQTTTLMAAREAQGLQLVALARLVYGLIFAPADLVLVKGPLDLLIWFLFVVAFGGLNGLFIWQLRRRRYINAIGLTGAIFDVLMLGAGATIWSQITHSAAGMWVSRSLIPFAAVLSILINGLALRPRYPIIVTLGMLGLMSAGLGSALLDPETVTSSRFLEVMPEPGELSVGLYLGAMMMVAICGGVTVIITLLSRKTIHKAVRLERLNTSLAESQVEVIIEEKVAALTQLAAGLSHELNTPLGAMSSTTETTSKLASKVRTLLEQESLKENRKLWRALDALEQSTQVTQDAGKRLRQIVDTLRQFIRLDEAERKPAELGQLLDETLSLLQHQLGQRIKVERGYADLPPLTCTPNRLSQVFFTLLRNAAESIEQQGTITIKGRRADSAIEIEIADTGRGIPPERLATLFDITFSPDQTRVHAAMGLAISRSVIRRHGGTISVKSEPGRGTSFTLTLPLSEDQAS